MFEYNVQPVNVDIPNDEKTLLVLNSISQQPNLSQREIALASGISLGLANLILKRLLHTGHIKITNLNKKKFDYLLTPKGFFEKTRRSYAYLTRAVNVFMTYKDHLAALVEDLIQKNHYKFAIRGSGEIARLLELVLQSTSQPVAFRFVDKDEQVSADEMILDCRLDGGHSSDLGVHILSALLTAAATRNQLKEKTRS